MIRTFIKSMFSVSSKELGKEVALGVVAAVTTYAVTKGITIYLDKRAEKKQ